MASTAVQDIAMPRLSDSMEEGTVLKWIKQVGDEVAVGEELVEIETDKANMGYEADVAGTLAGDPGGGERERSGRGIDRSDRGSGRKGSGFAGRGSCHGRGPTVASGS